MGDPNSTQIPGSKSGIMKRPIAQIESTEQGVSRTGIMIRRKELYTGNDDVDRQRESGKPTTLPERNHDDGGTTGIADATSEGQDRPQRENHPRR